MGIPFITMDAHNIINDNVAQGCGYPNNGQIVEISAEGSVVSFETNVAAPLVSLEAQIVAQQSGSGTPSPSNVRPISGFNSIKITNAGKNVCGGEAFADNIVNVVNSSMAKKGEDSDGKYVRITASSDISHKAFAINKFKSNTQYTLVIKAKKHSTHMVTNLAWRYTDGTTSSISFPTGTENDIAVTFVVSSASNKSVSTIEGYYGTGYTDIYYEETGVFEGVVTADDYEAYNGTSVAVQLGQTVYGGSLNVTTGELTITHGYIDSYAGESINEPWISSIDEYTSGETPTTGAEVVYPLAEEITVQLTPTEVNTIIGINNISANTGDVALTYIRVNK